MKRIITVILTICMMVSLITIPTIEVSAASTPKAPSKVTLSSAATSQSQIKLTWKKVKGANGYVVYRNNKYVKTLTAKALTYTDSKLKASTKYSYKVRAYKTYKQTQYYNSKTKKWVTKKPAKKNWKGKKTRKVNKYKYGKWSAVKTATTKAAVAAKKTQTIAANDKTVRTGYTVNIGASVSSKLPLTYSTSNSSIATVNSNGVITGKKAGTAIITIKQAGNASYNAATKTIRVTVIADTNTGNSSDNNTGNNNSNNNSNNNNSNTNSNTGNNNNNNSNNNTSNAVAYKAFKVLESTSVINIKDNGTVKVQLPANNFTVTWSSSDNDCISVQGSGNTATLTAKKKYGESIKITAKLNVPSGSTYTGKTEVSIYVTNTVFPRDADGKYTLTSDGKYWYCGGIKCDYNFYTITDEYSADSEPLYPIKRATLSAW